MFARDARCAGADFTRWAEEGGRDGDAMPTLAVATQTIPFGTGERVLKDQAEGES